MSRNPCQSPDIEDSAASDAGATARLILGNARGVRSPVTMQSEIFSAGVVPQPSAQVPLPDDHEAVSTRPRAPAGSAG